MRNVMLFLFMVVGFCSRSQVIQGIRGEFRDSVTSFTNNTDLELNGKGTGSVFVDDSLTVSGNVVNSGTGALKLHSGTTAQRPGSPANGMLRNNTTTNKIEAYENSSWKDVITSGDISFGTDNQIPFTNSAGDDFEYSANLTYDGTDLDVAGSPVVTDADIGSTVQAFDSDLTAIAGLSSTGLIARTGSGTAAVRTLTGTSNEITVTNGDGVSGNPTISVPTSLNYSGKTFTNAGTMTTVDINGGTIDGTTIGGTTPAAGTFTTGIFGTTALLGSEKLRVFDATTSELLVEASSTTSRLHLRAPITEILMQDVTSSAYDAKLETNGNFFTIYGGNTSGSPASNYFSINLNGGAVSTGATTVSSFTNSATAGTGTRLKTATSAGVDGAIANGTDGQVMTLVSGAPAWSSSSASVTSDYTPTFALYGGTPNVLDADYVKTGDQVLVSVAIHMDATADTDLFDMTLPFTSFSRAVGVVAIDYTTTTNALLCQSENSLRIADPTGTGLDLMTYAELSGEVIYITINFIAE